MRNYLFLFCVLISSSVLVSQHGTASIEETLFNLPDIQFQKIDSKEDVETFEVMVRQPVDHHDIQSEYFYQRVVLEHRGYDRPTVMNTNGYALSNNPPEIVDMLDANLLNIEHRYFGNSIPDSVDWRYLNLIQVTADLHHIHELFNRIYKEKWISTGISKGGQTTIYYRYFYPDDVDVSIPYVAPVNKSVSDPRIYDFLDSVGPADCRSTVFKIQKSLLMNKEWMLERLKWYAIGKEMTFDYVGSLEAAYELAVLEYPFSFWQGGSDCALLPALENNEALLNHFIDAVGLSLYDDRLIAYFAPHYYQAATEMGYYSLRTEGLEQWIDIVGENPSAAFTPLGIKAAYNPETNQKVHQWLETLQEDMIFLYGEYDTWSATRAITSDGSNVLYMIVDDEDHGGARMENLSEQQWIELVTYLKTRHGLVLSH